MIRISIHSLSSLSPDLILILISPVCSHIHTYTQHLQSLLVINKETTSEMSSSGEALLKLIAENKLTSENIKTCSAFINYSKDSNDGYLTPLMNALINKRVMEKVLKQE